jgi:hypothetical protein
LEVTILSHDTEYFKNTWVKIKVQLSGALATRLRDDHEHERTKVKPISVKKHVILLLENEMSDIQVTPGIRTFVVNV